MNGNREIDGGLVTSTTERIIGAGIVSEKNYKTHSTQKVETDVDQLENRNSIVGGNNQVNTNINNNNNNNNNINNNNNNKQLSTIFPTFATRFNFPKETTPLPESTTTKVDVEKLEQELLDVLDRLAQSYTESPDSQ